MTRDQALRLAENDCSSDFCENVGEHGGYFSVDTSGGVLTVCAEEYDSDDDNAELVRSRYSWRLVPVAGRSDS